MFVTLLTCCRIVFIESKDDKDDAALGKFAILAWCILGALLHNLKKNRTFSSTHQNLKVSLISCNWCDLLLNVRTNFP